MRCSDRRDQLPEYLLGLLPEEEAAPLRAHLGTGCPACAAALAEAEATLGLLPQALPAVAPPPALRARVLAQAMRADGGSPRIVPPRRGWLLPVAWAASLVLAAGGALSYATARAERSLDGLRQRIAAVERDLGAAQAQLATVGDERSDLSAKLAAANETIGMLRAERLQLITLAAAGPQPAAARARALWDQDTQHWQLIATGLRPAPAGRVYQMWFITADERKVPAGTFTVDERGQVVHTVEVPRDIGVIRVTAITDEPGAMLAPTGAIQLAGTL